MVATTANGLNSCLTNARCARRTTDLSLRGCDLLDEDIPDISACFDRIGRRRIRTLDLSINELTSVPLDFLAGFRSLQTLSFEGNFLNVQSENFRGAAALQELNLADNAMSSLPIGSFEGLTSLRELDLDCNKLSLQRGSFEGASSVEILRLSDNELETLAAGSFEGLTSLRELFLIGNDDLQCLPAIPASVTVDLQFDADATCECPEFPTCDENGRACECQPGTDGYSCAGSSSRLIPAFECVVSALVDAGERTTVTVEATGLDARTSGSGCSPSGCIPENTRDNNLEANSRWSCSGRLVDGNEDCCIEYSFDEPQDIVNLNIAFTRGTERTRLLNVFDNGNFLSQIESSGLTDDFEEFVLNSDETAELTLCLDDSRPDSEFLSITEVQFMVE